MDYLLDRKTRVNTDSEFNSLYRWSLSEFDDEGAKIDGDWVPFTWSQWFTATSLNLDKYLSIENENEVGNDDTQLGDRACVSSTKSVISGMLVSGYTRDGCHLEDQVRYSLFGTSRHVTEFHLTINQIDKGGKESCTLFAIPSYAFEGKTMRTEIEPDYIGFDVNMDRENFQHLASLIEAKAITSVSLLVRGVYGVYSHWTPTIVTSAAKVLSKDCNIENAEEASNITIPYVGEVREFQMSVSSKTLLYNLQQSKSANEDYEDRVILDRPLDSRGSFDDQAFGRELCSLKEEAKGLKFLLWLIVGVLILALLK